MHKTILQYDVIAKLCKEPNCTIQPSFGYINTSGDYCKQHSLPGMINLKGTLCSIPNCVNKAKFGYENQNVTYCGMHYLNDMIKIKQKSYKKK